MKPPQGPRSGSLEFNMTPMIDVVFLLIIFFLLSSHLAQQETQWELRLPEATTGQDPPEPVQRRVVVNVLPEGTALVAGEPISPLRFQALLVQERRRANGGKVEVLFRTDRQVPYRVVEPLLVACARAGVWQVAFAVRRHEPLLPGR